MELPILLLTPLPESAVKLVTQFLRKPHPCAMLIAQLTFYYEGVLKVETGSFANYLCIDAGDYGYRFCYIIETGESFHDFPLRAIIPLDDDDEDDIYHLNCPGCSNCVGY